ncbi:hypothetical protein MGYG_01767 [Nannizzia gypsea CBS 118893]|uniref:Probable aspartic-type endopeptidase CTSD n=1 Tax=Arthroderma gypseum (strain ATCC MYA-4604 / CBS 118893) TaxID=535722 RepID=E5R345_ARTGP|nr:hypothetical protein MGYG_01767 [Nannizzia gypsea CBS 118893]EFQ98749.1 hypothetical protein MGYG_01767 [Nannizzia gypsea CBS 118893]
MAMSSISSHFLPTGTLAFYPIKLPDFAQHLTSNHGHVGRRFFTFPGLYKHAHIGSTTLNIKRRPSNYRRDNNYPALIASPPTVPSSLGINNDGFDFSYFSEIKIGSEGQKMWMLIDTGASSSWVFGSDCTSKACEAHNTFGKEDSKTIKITNEKWAVTYGTGKVSGVMVNDTMSFAGFELVTPFGSASTASEDFLNYPMDGILGVGPQDPNAKFPTVLQLLMQQNHMKKNVIGINLQRSSDGATDGQITFGDIDTSKFSGELTYSSVVPNGYQWEIAADDFIMDGEPLNFKGRSGIIDTGTSFLILPPADAELVHSKIPQAVKGSPFYTVPCSTKTDIKLSIAGVKYTIQPKDYVGYETATKGICNSLIVGQQFLGPKQWLVGDVFLKNVYSVYDYDKRQVGLAARKYGETKNPSSSGPSPAPTSNKAPGGSPGLPAESSSGSSPTSATGEPNNKPTSSPNAASSVLMPTWLSLAVFLAATSSLTLRSWS